MYRIGESDTLSGIAVRTLGRASRWQEIFTLNRDRLPSMDRLAVGDELRLPPDASYVQFVGKYFEYR